MPSKIGFFESEAGVKSSTRLVFIVGAFWAIGMGTFFAFHAIPPMQIAGFVASIVGVFGGVKATVGALSENNSTPSDATPK